MIEKYKSFQEILSIIFMIISKNFNFFKKFASVQNLKHYKNCRYFFSLTGAQDRKRGRQRNGVYSLHVCIRAFCRGEKGSLTER